MPVCTPSRAEVLSGRTGVGNGVRWFGEELDDDVTLLPEALASTGYRTCFTGKWHLETHPSDAGYDDVRRYRPGGMIEGDHWIEFDDGDGTVSGHSTDLGRVVYEYEVEDGHGETLLACKHITLCDRRDAAE